MITDKLDVPADLIAYIYALRWLIELFFKMFKHLLGCRHLLSTKQNGVEIQVYCIEKTSGDHRLHLDLALHRSKPNQANLRDDLLLYERMGKPWGVGGTHRKNETLVFLGALRFKRTESVRCCAVGKI